jgi:hypothetical protein
MQVVVNQDLVRRRVRLASAFHLTALLVFAIGLFISWNQQEEIDWEHTVGAYTAIVIGLVLYNFGQVFLRRWGPRFRQDGALARALKGLDNRYTFLAFRSTKLPDYILVGPGGIQVIVARNHDGNISCRGDRWTREMRGGLLRIFSFFGGNPLGDPGADVARGVHRVREHLRKHGFAGEEPPIGGLVVFTNPNAKLRIDGCAHPVTTARQIRNYVRTVKGPLNRQVVARIIQALEA